VRRFCDQAIVISHGRIICRDTLEEGLRVYRESAGQPAAVVAG
jgi:ABC-type polysaccharide/polyol phosphate transport system ATPase subunit